MQFSYWDLDRRAKEVLRERVKVYTPKNKQVLSINADKSDVINPKIQPRNL